MQLLRTITVQSYETLCSLSMLFHALESTPHNAKYYAVLKIGSCFLTKTFVNIRALV